MTIPAPPLDTESAPAGDPFLRYRLTSLPLFVVPMTAAGALIATLATRSHDAARSGLLMQGTLFGFYAAVALWAYVESSLAETGPAPHRMFGPLPRGAHALEGLGVTVLHLVFELALAVTLLVLVATRWPEVAQKIFDRLAVVDVVGRGLGPIARAIAFTTLVLLGPATEEFVFRGVIFHRMAARWGMWRGLLFSSLIFGMLHGERALGATSFGVLMALLYLRSGSLVVPTLCHAVNNFVPWVVETMDRASPKQIDVSDLIAHSQGWLPILGVTAACVLLYDVRRWPARDTRPPWPAAAGGAEP
jgi:membrane protease YdiL (CAAX protease family)